jgi:hypothetical protein
MVSVKAGAGPEASLPAERRRGNDYRRHRTAFDSVEVLSTIFTPIKENG